MSALKTGAFLHSKRYILRQTISRNSVFSIVYLATDNNLKRDVAIKEFFPRDYVSRSEGATVSAEHTDQRAAFEAGLQRFLKEAEHLAAVKQQHPSLHLPAIYDRFEENGTAYIVMELILGRTLARLGEAGQKSTMQDLQRVLDPLLDTLAAIHSDNLLHRDIKPDNIIIRDSDASPVLIDFGAARIAIGTVSQTLTKVFSAGFTPPEQTSNIPGVKQGPYTDLYSLAATIYCWLTGQLPPSSTDRMQMIMDLDRDPLIPMSTLLAGREFDAGLIYALESCLNLKAKDRPQSVKEFRSLTSPPLTEPPPYVTPPRSPRIKTIPKQLLKWARYVGFLLIFLVVIFVLVWIFYVFT